jgi:hypothetical protein
VRELPPGQRPSKLARDATVGAVWAIVHDYVMRGHAERLPELTDDATYLALTPVIGHEATLRLLTDTRGVADARTDRALES